MDPLKLFSLKYLFDETPGQDFRYFWVLLVFFLLLIVFGQYFRKHIKGSPHKKILKQLFPNVANKLTTFAIFGYIFLFFRYENIPYLAMRFWLIALIIWALYYLGSVAHKFFKVLPEKVAKKAEKKVVDKYLPKPKKKKKKKKKTLSDF